MTREVMRFIAALVFCHAGVRDGMFRDDGEVDCELMIKDSIQTADEFLAELERSK